MPAIPASKRQEDPECKASFGYTDNLRPAWLHGMNE